MWTSKASHSKGCAVAGVLGDLVPLSPCSLDGASSVSRTTSSDCSSLFCTETVGEFFFDELETFGSAGILPAGTANQKLTNTAANAKLRSLGTHIRDDLRKQAEARATRSSHGTGLCESPRRLPPSYRARMVGWMCEVSDALGLHLSTLYAAVSVLDRFVASSEALPSESLLQLLTIACMSVAVKYNEVGFVPQNLWLSLAVNSTGKQLYGAQDLQRFEWRVLHAIDWRLNEPTLYTFLEQFLMCHPNAPLTLDGAGPLASGHALSAVEGPSSVQQSSIAWQPPPPQAMSSQAAASLAWRLLTSRALSLAGSCLTNEDIVMSYEPSTLALACVAVTECLPLDGFEGNVTAAHRVASLLDSTQLAGAALGGWAASSGAIQSAVEMELEEIAPCLIPCAKALAGLAVRL